MLDKSIKEITLDKFGCRDDQSCDSVVKLTVQIRPFILLYYISANKIVMLTRKVCYFWMSVLNYPNSVNLSEL